MLIEVTNLNVNLIESDLQRLFTPFGEISRIIILRDKNNNRSRGKAVIEMPVLREAQKAIAGLIGFVLANKAITVTEMSATEEDHFIKNSLL